MSFTVVISRVVLEESNEGSFADSFSLNEEQSLAQAECCFCTLTTGICVHTKKKHHNWSSMQFERAFILCFRSSCCSQCKVVVENAYLNLSREVVVPLRRKKWSNSSEKFCFMICFRMIANRTVWKWKKALYFCKASWAVTYLWLTWRMDEVKFTFQMNTVLCKECAAGIPRVSFHRGAFVLGSAGISRL